MLSLDRQQQLLAIPQSLREEAEGNSMNSDARLLAALDDARIRPAMRRQDIELFFHWTHGDYYSPEPVHEVAVSIRATVIRLGDEYRATITWAGIHSVVRSTPERDEVLDVAEHPAWLGRFWEAMNAGLLEDVEAAAIKQVRGC